MLKKSLIGVTLTSLLAVSVQAVNPINIVAGSLGTSGKPRHLSLPAYVQAAGGMRNSCGD
jgi:hypothetical protein